jgi:ribosomal-protein-alanine N-acetyltransferase
MPRAGGGAVVARAGYGSWEDAAVTWHLETARLQLRPMVPDDLDALHAVVSDPVSMRFYPKPFDREMTRQWIERAGERYTRDGYGLLAVVEKATGELIGDCGPMLMETKHGAFTELGWHIRRDRQGLGFATEAGTACRDRAWELLDVDRLISIIRPENVPSWSVARGIGFHPWRCEVRVGMAHIIWTIERAGVDRDEVARAS